MHKEESPKPTTTLDTLPIAESEAVQGLLFLLDKATSRAITLGEQYGVKVDRVHPNGGKGHDIYIPVSTKKRRYEIKLSEYAQELDTMYHIQTHAEYDETGNKPNHVRDHSTYIRSSHGDSFNRYIFGKNSVKLFDSHGQFDQFTLEEIQAAIDFMKDVLTAEPDVERAKAIYEEKKEKIGVTPELDIAIVTSVKLGK